MLKDIPYCKGVNAILELTQKVVDPATISDYCDPEYTLVTNYLYMSVEQTRNYRELEISGSVADMIYLRGRLVKPKRWKGFSPHQESHCFKWLKTPYVEAVGIARILPEASSRLGLESVFNTHIQLEVRLDNTAQSHYG